MEGTFAAILGRQEREDAAAAHSEAALRQAVCREFVNGKALLAAADFCMTDFFAAERTALPAVPVRTAAKFGIKKHTASQRPYRHGHDFYELICVHGGCCRQRVGDTPLLLAQGQCCLLSPGAKHEMERCGRGDVVLKLVIPPPLFAAADGKALLAQTELSIEQIAAEVGYADPSAFYRQFAAAFGMTPGEYRRLYAE